jgi:hypothetical protein
MKAGSAAFPLWGGWRGAILQGKEKVVEHMPGTAASIGIAVGMDTLVGIAATTLGHHLLDERFYHSKDITRRANAHQGRKR